jgi:acyl-CoA reductase-like NAD-dependent aldehyde dehydrogenase
MATTVDAGVTVIRDPASGEEVGRVPQAGRAEAGEAIARAAAAFPGWWETPAAKRGAIVRAGAEAVLAQLDELARQLTLEQGKPLREARIEITRFVHTIEHYAGLAKSLRGAYVPNLDERAHGLVVKRPLGVVIAIVPWNFPTTLLGNKLGPALVCGNTIVAKPAESTPLTTLRIAELMGEAGLPDGVFQVITGKGSVLGEPLVTDPRVAKVAFTGSTPVGKQVAELAARGVKRVTLELGGSDPMIVLEDADVDAAVSAASVGRFFNCGQACLAVKRLYVQERVADEVVEKLRAKVAKLRVGAGSAQGTMLGPLHSESQRAILEDQVSATLQQGGELLTGGKRPDGDELTGGWFYEPTLILEPPRDSKVAVEEVFGPALPIWRVRGLDEAIQLANASQFGLGSSVWTRDLTAATVAAEKLEAGYTWINSPQIVYDELPFGGFGESGLGKEHGNEALDYYQEAKSVVVRQSPAPEAG